MKSANVTIFYFSPMKINHAITSVLGILLILILPHSELIPNFGYSIPILLLVWAILKYQGKRFDGIGFSFKWFSWKAVGVGVLTGIIVFVLLQMILFPVLEQFIEFDNAEFGLNTFLKQNIYTYLFILGMGWLIGGVYEEIVFHGFIFKKIKEFVGGKNSTVVSFLFTAVLFGLYHYQMGVEGTLNAFLAGMIYHGISLKFKGNLWYGVFCHGTYNSIVISCLYFDI